MGCMEEETVCLMRHSAQEDISISKYLMQVIYGLNTKNDEAERVAAHAERLHEEQLNKVYEEMQMKIEHYRQVR